VGALSQSDESGFPMMQHTGEEWFQLQWPQYAILAAVLATYLLLSFTNKLPSMQAFKDFADVINSAGGNIILLSLFTAWSIKIAMQFFYHILALTSETISKQDAIVTTGIAFVTGTLVGTFAGALIKTLTGGKANGGGESVPDKLTAGFVAAEEKKPPP
jgi:hypothetical protein